MIPVRTAFRGLLVVLTSLALAGCGGSTNGNPVAGGSEFSITLGGFAGTTAALDLGQTGTVQFAFTNSGTASWTFGTTASLRRPDGTTMDLPLQQKTVSSGASATVSWSVTYDATGQWDIRVEVWKESAAPLANRLADSDWVLDQITVSPGDFVLLAWNDLGMHCLNPTYDQAVILPPYNTIWAQIIRRGNPPQVTTAGLTVEYRLMGNTYSYGKTDSRGGNFAQFWDNVQALFGVALPHDLGLNLVDPARHNGLSGTMVVSGDHFQVNGIPATPVNDAGAWSPYQVAEITLKDAGGAVLKQTRTTVPTSDEIDCVRCHAQGGSGTASIGGGQADVFHNILAIHDRLHGKAYDPPLIDRTPVLCATCHSSPALGGGAPGEIPYLSAAIHGSHAGRGAACYDCHPGAVTRCNRSLAHTATDGLCTTCHGTMTQVASSITTGGRVPWGSEPQCSTCHTTTQGVDTGAALYRNSTGHGGIYCAGCHGSPHAMVPSREAADNYQAIQYQNSANTLGSCSACHSGSRGDGSSEFAHEHGGSGSRRSACNICHTAVSGTTSAWPHAFTWKSR